jgi:polyprenyl-phospho-N-acetylgalactosaminyl synthase
MGKAGELRDNEDVWIVIPVYGEEKVIAAVVDDVLHTFPNVVCVDDGSTDNSAAEVAGTRAHLVRHPVNLGQGAALQTGMSYALARTGGRYFATFDADGQHRVEDVGRMLEVARSGTADVVLGSRFLDGDHSGAAGVPRLKRLLLPLVARLSPTARRLRLTDAHNGLRVLNRPAAESLRITQNRMAHASEIVGWLARSKWTVAETPVTVLYTDYKGKGQSLINGVNILFDVSLNRRK